MKKLLGKLRGSVEVAALLLLAGCVCYERDVAREIDFTPQIIQQASDLLAATPDLGRFRIVVDGFKGDMWIRGLVQTPAQRLRAEKIVWAVQGVRSVRNEIDLTQLPRSGAPPR